MARQIVQTDFSLKETLAVSGSSATYSVGFDLVDTRRASNSQLFLALDLTYTSGAFVISLIGDSALPLDGSSVAKLTLPSIGATGLYFLPIPQNFNAQYVGISLTGVAHAGSIDIYVTEQGY